MGHDETQNVRAQRKSQLTEAVTGKMPATGADGGGVDKIGRLIVLSVGGGVGKIGRLIALSVGIIDFSRHRNWV